MWQALLIRRLISIDLEAAESFDAFNTSQIVDGETKSPEV